MAKLAAKVHLVAAFDVMVAAHERGEAFSEDEIVNILMAMAEMEEMASRPPTIPEPHWQQAPQQAL